MVLNAASGARNAQVAMQAMIACDVALRHLRSVRYAASRDRCRIGTQTVTPKRRKHHDEQEKQKDGRTQPRRECCG